MTLLKHHQSEHLCCHGKQTAEQAHKPSELPRTYDSYQSILYHQPAWVSTDAMFEPTRHK